MGSHQEGVVTATSIGVALRRGVGFIVATCLLACSSTPEYPPTAPSTGRRSPPKEASFTPSDLLKSDIDAVAEVHLRESIASAKLLMEKLYRRNPRELRKGSNGPTPEGAVARAFDPHSGWRFAELNNQRGIEALQIAFRPDFGGDRVFAFGVGLGSMIAQAYNDKTEFYVTESLDPQRLYNAARNIEIAAWKLANARAPNGEPMLLSNDMATKEPNLSFEREVGKLIAYQDTLAIVMAQRTNRTIRRVTQSLATAVFLPL